MISNFLFIFINVFVIDSFLTKLLILGILFSAAVRTVVLVAKLVVLGILLSKSFIIALRAELVAKVVILGISYLL